MYSDGEHPFPHFQITVWIPEPDYPFNSLVSFLRQCISLWHVCLLFCTLFRLSAEQNSLPGGLPPIGSAFYAADKQDRRAEKVNKLSLRLQLQFSKKQCRKYNVKLKSLMLVAALPVPYIGSCQALPACLRPPVFLHVSAVVSICVMQ